MLRIRRARNWSSSHACVFHLRRCRRCRRFCSSKADGGAAAEKKLGTSSKSSDSVIEKIRASQAQGVNAVKDRLGLRRGSFPKGYDGSYETYESMRESIRKLDASMRYKEYHTLRWSAGFLFVVVLVVYYNRDELKLWFGSTSADITSRTLGDQNVQREAQNLAQHVVYELLNDAKALSLTTEFLNQLLERETTRRAVLDLLASVAARDETQLILQNLFIHILEKEGTKTALRELFAALLADPEMQQYMAEFFQHVMNSDTFRNSAYVLGTDTTHDLLNNKDISEHAISWVQDVLGEPSVHNKAGDAIWGAITSTFVPGFLGGGRKKEIINIDEAIASLEKSKSQAKQQDPTQAAVIEAADEEGVALQPDDVQGSSPEPDSFGTANPQDQETHANTTSVTSETKSEETENPAPETDSETESEGEEAEEEESSDN